MATSQGATTEILQKRGLKLNADGDSEYYFEYISPSGTAFNYPALGSVLTGISGISGNYKLVRAESDGLQKQGYYSKKLSYVLKRDEQDLPVGSYTTYSESAAAAVVPITQHPDFETLSGTHGYDPTIGLLGDRFGINIWYKPSVQVTKREFSTSNLTSRFEDIGTLETPGGGYGGANKWLVVGTTRSKAPDGNTRETTYLHSAEPWPTDIYT